MKKITAVFVTVVVMVMTVMALSSFVSSANYGKCHYCSCKSYTPGPNGTTFCKCGHSKHSHIGM